MSVSKGLGRGLDALIPTDDNLNIKSKSSKETLINVPVNSIEPNSLQPRQTFSDESLADLAESIRENGIIQPLIVVRKGNGFELVAGERRLRAAKVVGLYEVPVIIRDAEKLKKLELALVENVQRDDLNVIEEALAYQKLMQDFSLTQEDVAKKVGKSRSVIANKVRLLSLPVEVKRAINTGQITEGHARALLGLNDKEKILTLCGLIIARKMSVRETEKKVNEILAGGKIKKDKVEADPNTLQLERELRDAIGTKVKIRSKRKGGQVVIDYTDTKDLGRIINLLKKK
ncbi:ParB/RepB/Spo0J family partition protein [candidate division WS5 bacterium]|uniref:ParB/RepB/Spo0J family partition protein n=1 Tax=candidate division WS5 bacterium TaxID=2093353 RepID=A0A419DE57_9BACT|nr:MAG: ParB/RepB/Spo0J family partition protein [candidate division WS5 bacterium]